MANRTTVTDNNTWNATHIARVGMILAMGEEEAHQHLLDMDIDYVLIIFGGRKGRPKDDLTKFGWMLRIAEFDFPRIKERDYRDVKSNKLNLGGGERLALKNSIMYKFSYYHTVNRGESHMYDTVRGKKIGVSLFFYFLEFRF